MSRLADNILAAAMQLSIAERAKLAFALLISLDGEPETVVEMKWAGEINRRLERIKSGTARGRPWEEVRKRLGRSGE